MGRNIEIKARVADPKRLRSLAAAAADSPAVLIEQHDTFYNTSRGRLKLRRQNGRPAELIWYLRPDSRDPVPSDYSIAKVSDPGSVDRALAAARGRRGVVAKRRSLLLSGRTRIHLDEVEGLGHFLELEVVLKPGESVESGRREAESLMASLEIGESDLLESAYIDLLVAADSDGPGRGR